MDKDTLHNIKTLVSTLMALVWIWVVGLDNYLRYYLLSYFATDFMFFYSAMRRDMILHHMVSLAMILFYWGHEQTTGLILTEVSTPFLALFKLHIWEDVNKVLFLVTFFYFRIYHIGSVLVANHDKVDDPAAWLIFVLYLLNCWWAEMIVRKLAPRSLKTMLNKLTPYTHFATLYNLSPKNPPWLNLAFLTSSLSSYLWHQYKIQWWYMLDLFGLHSLSFLFSLRTVSSPWVWLSLPLHVADVLFYYTHHRLWVFPSIAYDVMLISFSDKGGFVWLLGWFWVALLLIRQTFGSGSTQAVVHLLVGSLLAIQ